MCCVLKIVQTHICFLCICVLSGSGGLDGESHSLNSTLLEYVDLTRQLLEAENDKDSDTLRDIRSHFSALVASIIQNVPGILTDTQICTLKGKVVLCLSPNNQCLKLCNVKQCSRMC